MVEIGSGPDGRRVTVGTVLCCWQMIGRLATCLGTVVARRAGANGIRMVESLGRCESDGAVAILTGVGRCEVGRVFARSCGAIMAGEAITGHARVVEAGCRPHSRRVTVGTVLRGRQMVGGFAAGLGAVMARRACSDGICVVESLGWREGDGAVAVLAGVGGSEVRGILAGGSGAVVAREAVARHA